MRRFALTAILFAAALLAGCDVVVGALGIESPEKLAAVREADGKAIGGACRHAGRAIEDCYALNRKADKASVFAGWRDMNDYMRENKIEPVPPQVATQLANAGGKPALAEVEPAKPAAASDKPAAKTTEAGKPARRDSAKAHGS
ncbi:MAG: hypothetical protein Q8R33_17905 [Burkholderiales bacterium]|nr:hypothetical protein [Burkholderiales bacterium]